MGSLIYTAEKMKRMDGWMDGQTDGQTGQKHICLQPTGRSHYKFSEIDPRVKP